MPNLNGDIEKPPVRDDIYAVFGTIVRTWLSNCDDNKQWHTPAGYSGRYPAQASALTAFFDWLEGTYPELHCSPLSINAILPKSDMAGSVFEAVEYDPDHQFMDGLVQATEFDAAGGFYASDVSNLALECYPTRWRDRTPTTRELAHILRRLSASTFRLPDPDSSGIDPSSVQAKVQMMGTGRNRLWSVLIQRE